MLFYIWMCVMLQAFAPGGERIAAHYVNHMESHVRAQVEAIEPAPAQLRPTPTQRVREAKPRAGIAR